MGCFSDAPYAKRGRPTKAMLAARRDLDKRWAWRQARLKAHFDREMAFALDLALLDGRTDATCDDWNAAYLALEADRMKIITAPL